MHPQQTAGNNNAFLLPRIAFSSPPPAALLKRPFTSTTTPSMPGCAFAPVFVEHKYQHAKFIPEIKEEKKASLDVKKVQPGSSGSYPFKNKNLAEALQMQLEVQKQLHEQLEVQRQLQLRIEEHAKYLHRILEEQQKTITSSGSSLSLKTPTEPSESTSKEGTEPEVATTSPQQSKNSETES
ncbi:hypothetical protein ZWY2020_003419 [Hordeum vulgare]|nr:hypothetical protein ZWY2020_003419 [Hordeum vulgare]